MKIATILPFKHMHLEEDEPYHMCLAHLLDNAIYREFFLREAEQGNFILMDNGVVETGKPMPMKRLDELARAINATEMVLPDVLNDCLGTLMLGEDSMKVWGGKTPLMAVPQGNNYEEWRYCLETMMKWPIKSIGISKFTKKFIPSRFDLLRLTPSVFKSGKEIHILGCNYYDTEMVNIETYFPNQVRGIDSGIAAFYTMNGLLMQEGIEKPEIEMDFQAQDLDEHLLMQNIIRWKKMCGGES